ncbi:hypothetical protein [Crocosphaera sp. XPORK-15E]|uniref:hypothetical protein n=1 Tax=Crocosphaera sp. XPORK-15E TaxID=3110247 RepID=UPI002B21E793|nr:hypothetical protein [Crocosphaera sp. XPORK-15E]MEA5536364.1 hypothetical protein [Crocosphaera sp. XPORK-15E]
MKTLTKNLLLSFGVIAGSLTSIVTPSKAVTLAKAQGSLEFTNFSHIPQEVATFQSAFAYILTQEEQNLTVVTSTPMFVTGLSNIFFHPSSTKIPANLISLPGVNLVTAPLGFNSVSGLTMGSNQLVYSSLNPEQLLSVNLSSQSLVSVSNIPHIVSTTGQSAFNATFYLEPEDRFSFDFNSYLNLETDHSLPYIEQAKVDEEQVIYFSAYPADMNINNEFLFFAFYPHMKISASNSNIDVGLLQIDGHLSEDSNYSLEVNGNGNPLNFSDYFKFEQNQNSENNSQGIFQYVAEQSTIITVAAYISSNAFSSHFFVPEALPSKQSVTISEPSISKPLFYFCIMVLGGKYTRVVFKLLLYIPGIDSFQRKLVSMKHKK